MSRRHDRGLCRRCTLADRLETLLPADAPAELAPLRAALIASASPGSRLTWLRRPEVRDTLAALAARRLPVSHEGLDHVADPGVATHLRGVLVSAGILAARDEHLPRLEQWVAAEIARLHRPTDRHLMATWSTWQLLRRGPPRRPPRPRDLRDLHPRQSRRPRRRAVPHLAARP